jgi:hypothetical protein
MLIQALLVSISFGFTAASPPSYKPSLNQQRTPKAESYSFAPLHNVFPGTYAHSGCNSLQISELKAAWDDAKLLAEAQTNIVVGYNYNLPHRTWLGDEWNAGGTPKQAYQAEAIEDNFTELARLFRGEMGGKQETIWRCTEEKDDSEEQCDGKTYASTYHDLNSVKTGYVRQTSLFCPLFFELEALTLLIDRYKDDKNGQLDMHNFESNTAHTMLHEIYHYELVALGRPQIIDYATGTDKNYALARVNGTGVAYVNADSYAFDALAIYLHQTFKSSMPTLRLT